MIEQSYLIKADIEKSSVEDADRDANARKDHSIRHCASLVDAPPHGSARGARRVEFHAPPGSTPHRTSPMSRCKSIRGHPGIRRWKPSSASRSRSRRHSLALRSSMARVRSHVTASPYIRCKKCRFDERRHMDFGAAARMITCARKGTSDHAPLAPSISRAHGAVRVEAASALVSMSSILRMIISRLSDAQSRSMLHSECSGSYPGTAKRLTASQGHLAIVLNRSA